MKNTEPYTITRIFKKGNVTVSVSFENVNIKKDFELEIIKLMNQLSDKLEKKYDTV